MNGIQFVFAEIIDNFYDTDEIFEDYGEAIFRAVGGARIAVLDACSLEYYGEI